MTNPAAPTPAPQAPGGMPKWLIIVAVIFLLVLFGCCGGFVACNWMCHRAATSLNQAMLDAEKRNIDLAHAQGALQGLAQPHSNTVPAPTGDVTNATPTNTPGGANDVTPAKPANTDAQATIAQSLPESFPSDIPQPKGLTVASSASDNVKGTGGVYYTGTGSHADLKSFYRTEMKNQGWTPTEDNDIATLSTLIFTKDTRKATIMIANDPTHSEQLMVTILYDKK